MVTELSDKDFVNEVMGAGTPVIVDFYADWCGPCKQLAPILEALEKELPNVKFVRVNVDTNPETTISYDISAIPTVIFFNKGKAVNTSIGLNTKEWLAKAIKDII
jgi:thioredoxin 1